MQIGVMFHVEHLYWLNCMYNNCLLWPEAYEPAGVRRYFELECESSPMSSRLGGYRRKMMTQKASRARLIGMAIGIAVLILALLWKRLLR